MIEWKRVHVFKVVDSANRLWVFVTVYEKVERGSKDEKNQLFHIRDVVIFEAQQIRPNRKSLDVHQNDSNSS